MAAALLQLNPYAVHRSYGSDPTLCKDQHTARPTSSLGYCASSETPMKTEKGKQKQWSKEKDKQVNRKVIEKKKQVIVEEETTLQDLTDAGNIIEDFITEEHTDLLVKASILAGVSDDTMASYTMVYMNIKLKGNALKKFNNSKDYSVNMRSLVKNRSGGGECNKEENLKGLQENGELTCLFKLGTHAELSKLGDGDCIIRFELSYLTDN